LVSFVVFVKSAEGPFGFTSYRRIVGYARLTLLALAD
jgi:hypothetical protein